MDRVTTSQDFSGLRLNFATSDHILYKFFNDVDEQINMILPKITITSNVISLK